MEDESPFDILELKTEPRPRPPTQLSKHLVLERRPQLLRAGRRHAKNSILICHFYFRRTLSKIRSALHILLSFNEK